MAVEFSIVEYSTFEKNNRFQITDFFLYQMRARVRSPREIFCGVIRLLSSLPAIQEPKASFLNGTEVRNCLKVCQL